jgi:hypothetical protein
VSVGYVDVGGTVDPHCEIKYINIANTHFLSYLTVMVNSSSNINIANTHFSFYLTVMVNSSSNINIANTHFSS